MTNSNGEMDKLAYETGIDYESLGREQPAQGKPRRVTIFRNEKGLMVVEEHLSKHPPGNAAQRKKAIKSGWRPEWIKTGRPMPFLAEDVRPHALIWLTPQFPDGVPQEESI